MCIRDSLEGVPPRFLAIKLLEGDPEIERLLTPVGDVVDAAQSVAGELEAVHGHEAAGVIAAERYAVAGRIAASAVTHVDAGTRQVLSLIHI